ncbi:MAG: glycoside hydrolase 5 family protein [Thermoguttaceae bacterium]
MKLTNARVTALLLAASSLGHAFALHAADLPPTSPQAPQSAVAIRDGAFVEGAGGKPFVPRGFNYIRLYPGRSHSTFDTEHYDPEAIDAALRRWSRDGFNVVRVFLNANASAPGTMAVAGRSGLSAQYLANVADFLDRARQHRVAVMLCTESFPRVPPYSDTLRRDSLLDEANASYLAAGHVEAKARFLQDLVHGIRAARPEALEAIFAYDLQNEFCFHGGPPFTLATGTVTAANGTTYSLPDERQQLADDGAIYFIDRMVDALHEVHPGALVGASVFTYAAVGRTGPGDFSVKQAAWQNRIPFRPLAILKSRADYLDLHFYSADTDGWNRDLDSVEFDRVRQRAAELGKPMIVGEFGAFKRPFLAVEPAAQWMATLAGLFRQNGFAGWLHWTYDTREQSDQLWHACDGESVLYESLKTAGR